MSEVVKLTISEFGRRAGLSHKALRLYDVSGLLAPARVDPVNGYRLYDASQLERDRRISVMRQLDMPLSTIAEVLAGTDEEALIRLDRWWAAQEATTSARPATLEYLHDRLIRSGSPGLDPRPVLVRDVPEADWHNGNLRTLGMFLAGDALRGTDAEGNVLTDNSFLLALNATAEPPPGRRTGCVLGAGVRGRAGHVAFRRHRGRGGCRRTACSPMSGPAPRALNRW